MIGFVEAHSRPIMFGNDNILARQRLFCVEFGLHPCLLASVIQSGIWLSGIL